VIGATLGRYRILEKLGEGGMGEVYRARDERLRRDVAIKILPATCSTDPDRVRRFEQEAQTAGSLNHPNVLAIYDVSTHEESLFIVSELLEGETLERRLAAGPLSWRGALDLALQVAQGLAAAHAKGIVHRDLKPANLFVTTDGRLKILDFGLAKLAFPTLDIPGDGNAPTTASPTHTGTVLGTIGYMSPEQVRGDAADYRSDIFSFGAILYEMIAGRPAFHRRSAIESMSAILRDEPPAMCVPDVTVPPALESIIRRCLEKRPEDRFQSAREIGSALSNVSSGASARVAAWWPPSRRVWGAAGAGVTMVAALVMLFSLADLRSLIPAGRVEPHVVSLVVLPLENLSNDPTQEYFSDGMTEAIIADLARLSGLRVISRTSAMTYKAARKPLPQIARELGVDAVVEGSVARSGDRVRITAQLIDARTDRHLWAQSYERDGRDVLSLQGEVARAIAQEIQITMTPTEEASLRAARPVNRDAHESYLRGRYRVGKATEQGLRQAISDFNQAIEADPSYAPPYAGLSDAYSALRFASYLPPHAVMPQAKAAAAKAVQLDSTLAEGHVSMAVVLMSYEFDWAGAERELRQAIDLSPNLADAHHYYALFLAGVGRHAEADAEIERARRLDPLSLWILTDAGWVYYLAREYGRMIEIDRQVIDLDPNFWPAHRDLGLGYEKVGRFADAVASLQKARELDSNSSVLEMLGGAYAAWGKPDEAKKVLSELDAQAGQRYVCPYEVATLHLGLGDKESALQSLEKGYQDRADCMAWAGADPKLDALREDPRFEDLIRRMGIPH
jgi:TolB-like protein/Tfp pilus assembly protein PilF